MQAATAAKVTLLILIVILLLMIRNVFAIEPQVRHWMNDKNLHFILRACKT